MSQSAFRKPDAVKPRKKPPPLQPFPPLHSAAEIRRKGLQIEQHWKDRREREQRQKQRAAAAAALPVAFPPVITADPQTAPPICCTQLAASLRDRLCAAIRFSTQREIDTQVSRAEWVRVARAVRSLPDSMRLSQPLASLTPHVSSACLTQRAGVAVDTLHSSGCVGGHGSL